MDAQQLGLAQHVPLQVESLIQLQLQLQQQQQQQPPQLRQQLQLQKQQFQLQQPLLYNHVLYQQVNLYVT